MHTKHQIRLFDIEYKTKVGGTLHYSAPAEILGALVPVIYVTAHNVQTLNPSKP